MFILLLCCCTIAIKYVQIQSIRIRNEYFLRPNSSSGREMRVPIYYYIFVPFD